MDGKSRDIVWSVIFFVVFMGELISHLASQRIKVGDYSDLEKLLVRYHGGLTQRDRFFIGKKMDITRVSPEDLMLIKTVGRTKAFKISNFVRKKIENGESITLDDLVEIKGVGRKTLEVLKEFLR